MMAKTITMRAQTLMTTRPARKASVDEQNLAPKTSVAIVRSGRVIASWYTQVAMIFHSSAYCSIATDAAGTYNMSTAAEHRTITYRVCCALNERVKADNGECLEHT